MALEEHQDEASSKTLPSVLHLPRSPRSYSEDNNSPLHTACYIGSYDVALMLILSGHDILARNVWLETPLHQCTSQGHLAIMMLLMDSGAAVNSLDHQSLTPLHQAVIHGNKDAAQLLMCYGAGVHNAHNVKDTLSVLQLASHVHVCHQVIAEADGKVWSLQHLSKIAIRKSLGAEKRRRIKELPLPRHLLSFLCSLPIPCSDELHQNWERVRSTKCEAVRKRGVARRPKEPKHLGSVMAAFRQ